jgi:DNA invertase Pin-like site-specific DNA recombinase
MTTRAAMKAAVYLRISSDPSGQQLGVGRQREDCMKLCEAKGWEPVEYLDNDISASNGKHRPAYEQMLTDIAAGRVGAVVTWDLDRLHRRPIELEKFMELADTHRLALATVAGDVDLSTAQGRLVARLKGDVARHEVEHMTERMHRKYAQDAKNGVPHWRRAFGYYDDTHEPDPMTAPLVKRAYNMVLAGSSLADVCRLWNGAQAFTLNGQPWTNAAVSKFLRKPRNAALREHNGEIIGKGTWPPLIDETTWRAAQTVLDGRPGGGPRGRRSVRRHLLTGVLDCGKCGHYLSGNLIDQGSTLVYSCKACRGVSVRALDIEPLVYELMIGRLAMPDAVDLLKAELHDEAEAETLRAELNTLYGRLEEIGVERGEGLLSGLQAKAASDTVNEKIAAVERRQQDQERLRVFEGLKLGHPKVAFGVRALSPDRFRTVLAMLATVTVMPVGRGNHIFQPERVQVNWK